MDIEKAINDDYQALFYPEPMPAMTDAEPEALPMESPAGSQTVTPAEFGMDMGNLVKGVVTGAAGLTGDVLAIGRGLFEIGRRGGDETKLDAFLGGMEAGTFVPTTENINQWIDENVGLPERMKGASTTGFIGEVVAPGGALTKVVKTGAKLIKRVPAKEIPKLFSHGTSEAAAEGIMASGKFDPSAGARNYSYSEFGRKAVYLTPDGGWWLDPKKSTEGRAVKYDASVISEVDPKAKIFRIDSVDDLEKIAKKAGFDSAEKMMISLNVENLDYLNQAQKTSSMSFENFVNDYVAQVREVFSGLDGAKEIKSLDDLNAFREQQGLGGFNMTLDEMKVGYEDAKTFEVRNFADSDKATKQLIDAGIDGIYVGPDFNGAGVIQGGPAPDQLAMFRPELVKPKSKKSLRQADSTATMSEEQKAK